MCVVNDKQVSPIWINHNTLIRVRASLPLGMYGRALSLESLDDCANDCVDTCVYREHARLTHLSEVVVTPKEREVESADKHLSADLYYEASPELFVQVHRQLAYFSSGRSVLTLLPSPPE